MAKETIEIALKHFDERYYKMRLESSMIDILGKNLDLYVRSINSAIANNESEEHLKNITNSFLKICFYQNDRFQINTYKRADSAITYDGVLYAIIEMKKPSNRAEMLREEDINKKALWELVYYYLCETRIVTGAHVKRNFNSEIRRLIISDSKNWFLINAQDLDKICQGDIEKLFYKFENRQLTYSDVDTFYLALQECFERINVTEKLRYVFFKVEEVLAKRNQWQYLLKVLRKDFLLRDGYKQISKTHVLNKNFYQELLYLMGLKENKVEGKNIIQIDHSIHNSMADQVYTILRYEKEKTEEEAIEETFELVLIWINRMLFIKLFEGQLISFNGDDPKYHILDNDKIHAFDQMQTLFFDVLGKRDRDFTPFLQQFDSIPYLNSSLFERYEIEKQDVNIREIRNDYINKKSGSALGKNAPDRIPLLEYLLSFLNAYNFSALNTNENDQPHSTSEIIDASVLGLIFEKINGYKEGSFYTKSFVTEYICQETIEKAVIDKLNAEFGWHCTTVDDLKMSIDVNSASEIQRINEIINSIHICDPAVGSGHFLVSAHNRIIALKRELGVLMKYGSSAPLREYDIAVIDDVLCVFDGQGREYKYIPTDFLSQEIQKTLFNEKRTIIEGCLFGVDINPNAVAICQLRLWIELLKNAYYENGVMETLPNIDINIKCGNSLIHKLSYEVGAKINASHSEIRRNTLIEYKHAVKRYHSESDKSEKNRLKQVINSIRSTLHAACAQIRYAVDENNQLNLTDDLEWSINRYENAFEWAIEFPEVISEDGVFMGFDCVIGNPPYIRVQELAHEDVDYYKKKYATAWKRIDISTLFIELGYNLVHVDGYVSYITSNQFLTAEYGRRIRDYIHQKRFATKMVDFADLAVFDGALTYVSIFYFKKAKANAAFLYHRVPSLPFILPTTEQWSIIPYNALEETEDWNIERIQFSEVFSQLMSNNPCPLTEYAKPHYGIVTGKDDVLMFDLEQSIDIEESVVLPVIRAQGCTRYGLSVASKKVIYPYSRMGDDTVLLRLSEIETSYPQLYDYIMNNEDILKDRKDSRSTFRDKEDWYGLVRFGQLKVFQEPKIVTPGEVKHNKFGLDYSGSGFTGARVFAISVIDDSVDIRFILSILNSKLIEFFLHHIAPRKAGGYYSYSTQILEKIPIIIPVDQSPFINLANNIVEKKTNGEDTVELEKQIDLLVYDLYGIQDNERRIIDEDLCD